MKKLNVSTRKLIKTINECRLLPEMQDTLTVSLLDNVSKDTLDRIGLRLLVDFETKYVNILDKYINKKYSIRTANLINEGQDELEKIDTLKSDLFIQLLLSFESIFSYCKRWLSIDNTEKLCNLVNTLQINSRSLSYDSSLNENLVELLTEIPYYIKRDFIKYELVLNFGDTHITIERGIKVQENSFNEEIDSPHGERVIKSMALN